VRRTPLVLVVVISAAIVLSGCGRVSDPPAAKVGAQTISRTELDDQLTALTDNTAWMTKLKASWQTQLDAPDGGVASQLSAAWLSTMINQLIVDQAFERQDLKVTDQDRATAKEAALNLFAGQETFDKFPRWFREDALHKQERFAAVAATLPPNEVPTDAQLRAVFASNGSSLCPTGLAILQIKSDTPEAAAAIEAELAQGADFGTIATQRSTDEQSAPNAGLAACKDTQQYQSLPEAERQSVDPLTPGGVTAVVPINSAFYIFKVVPWTYEIARPILVAQYTQQQALPVDRFISVRLKQAKIWVDPRYGSVKRTAGRVVIQPPVAPTPKSDPAETPSTTAPAGATGQ
jgi:parvulin-like peptidyl-prolyl isomerase